jgi:hypothetical protein
LADIVPVPEQPALPEVDENMAMSCPVPEQPGVELLGSTDAPPGSQTGTPLNQEENVPSPKPITGTPLNQVSKREMNA